MTENPAPIPSDRVLPQMRFTELDTVTILEALETAKAFATGDRLDRIDQVLSRVQSERAHAHDVLQRMMEKERLNAIVREQMPRMVKGARVVTCRDRHWSKKQVLHATIVDAGHDYELGVLLDDGTYDKWSWSDPMLRLEGEAEYDETPGTGPPNLMLLLNEREGA